jgi:hypothetical protein
VIKGDFEAVILNFSLTAWAVVAWLVEHATEI